MREKQQQKEAKVLSEFMGKLEEIESIRVMKPLRRITDLTR